MTARVLKWTVPIDDQPHKIGTGPVVLVACQSHRSPTVQVWTLEVVDEHTRVEPWKPVQVFGTGQPIPRRWAHIGSTVTANGALVWHVFEAPPGQWAADTGVTP